MIPGSYDLQIYRGDTEKWKFKLWSDVARTIPISLTGATAKAEIRSAPGATPVVAMTCVITQPNIIDVTLSAALSATVPATGVWDLQVTHTALTDIRTYVAGKVTAVNDVTDSVGGTFLMAAGIEPEVVVAPSTMRRRAAS